MTLRLADLLGDVPEDLIRAHLAARTVLHLPGGCGVPPEAIYSMAQWEKLLARGGVDPGDLRVTFDGNAVDLKGLGLLDAAGRAKPMALRDLVRQGASIVTSNLQRCDPVLWDLVWDVERRTGARCLAHILGSFSERVALPVHYDREDILVVQLAGSKTWRIFGDPAPGPARRSGSANKPETVTQVLTLEPGDLMLVPAGTYHQCEAAGHSLHLGLMLQQPEPADYVRHLLASDPGLNEPLSPMLGAEAVAEREAAFKARLIELVEQADIARWLAKRDAGRSALSGLDLLEPGDAGAPGAVASLASAQAPVTSGDRLEAAGKSVAATPAMRAVLAALVEGPKPVAALADIAGAREALDALAAAGLVHIAIG